MTGYVPKYNSSFSVPKLYDFQEEVFLSNKLSRSCFREEEEEEDECFFVRTEN